MPSKAGSGGVESADHRHVPTMWGVSPTASIDGVGAALVTGAGLIGGALPRPAAGRADRCAVVAELSPQPERG